MNIEAIVAIVFLVILSAIDIKTYRLEKGYIPAILTTGFLILMFILSDFSLYSGILAGLFGLLLTDFDIFAGVADLKAFIAAGMTFSGIFEVSMFTIIVLVISFVYKAGMKHWNVADKHGHIPFIPALAFAYLGAINLAMYLRGAGLT